MDIETSRFALRDLADADRGALVGYQRDPRYRFLYGLPADGDAEAEALFDRIVGWQGERPRRNVQLGVFAPPSAPLCGLAGLREIDRQAGAAEFGMELDPAVWGRYRLAVDVATALVRFGFGPLGLAVITGTTTSANAAVARIARWFGAIQAGRRRGPDWMAARGWEQVDWRLDRNAFLASRACRTLAGRDKP